MNEGFGLPWFGPPYRPTVNRGDTTPLAPPTRQKEAAMSDAPERIGLVEMFGNYALWSSTDYVPEEVVAQYLRADLATRREADAYRAGLEAAAAKMDEKARLAQSEGEELARQCFYALAVQQRHHAEAFAEADAAIRAMMGDTP